MGLFLKAMFLLLLTGPSAVSKRINTMTALSQSSTVKDLQPTPSYGIWEGFDLRAKPAGPSTDSKRLDNPKAPSSSVKDLQPTPVEAQTKGDAENKPEGIRQRQRQRHPEQINEVHNGFWQFRTLEPASIRSVNPNPATRLSGTTLNFNERDPMQLFPYAAKARNQLLLTPAQAAKDAAEVTPMDDDNKAPQPSDLVRETDQHTKDDEETKDEEEKKSQTAPAPPASPEENAPPASTEEKMIVAQPTLTPAEEAEARWSEASPSSETSGEPEEPEAPPATEAAKESFAHLSTTPLFLVFFATAAALLQ